MNHPGGILLQKFYELFTYNLERIILGKKTTVGHFVIGPDVGGTYGEQWKQALAKSGQQITKWQSFE